MGPIALFDKSFLQGLSVDEAVWFDHYFTPVVAPLLFIETLADLYKEPRAGKTPEEEVGLIAIKTPQMSGIPCVHHHALCHQDLLGNSPPLNGQVPRAGIRVVQRKGRLGGVGEESPEAKAFSRWQKGQFNALEHEQARGWREAIRQIDLGAIASHMKTVWGQSEKCKTLVEVHELATQWVHALTRSNGRFEAALQLLQVPAEFHQPIKERWKHIGKPDFYKFAPYAAHVLTVELFFVIAIGSHLIASTRQSHRVDIAYLHYLPFSNIFISSDHLHRSCAPFFLRKDQSFVWGLDLKPGLRAIDDHFKAMDEDIRATGIYAFADHLPDINAPVIGELYAKYTKQQIGPKVKRVRDPGVDAKLINELSQWKDAPPVDSMAIAERDLETLMIERLVMPRRGSWIQITDEQAAKQRES